VSGWNVIRDTAKERGFHDKTRFPLRGGHVTVACKDCHGPFPGRPAKFKGLAHDRCMDCHTDAHNGQLAKPACERCHTVQSFSPPRFELEDHAKTRFPLEGAHRAVACSGCHPSTLEPKGKPDRGRHKRDEGPKQPISLVALRPPGDNARCETCHADPHGDQFRAVADGCKRCHVAQSFTTELTFDHQRDSRFPLTGKHATTDCRGCHQAPRAGAPVRYKPIDGACTTCHADPHLGQFASRTCDFCHDTASWQKIAFQHNDTRFTSYPLEGKHAQVRCAACHRKVEVAPGLTVVRYKPLPRACEACHADAHHGAFRGFEP
jgi:hypothetical protein